MATQVSLNDGAIASAGALAIQTNGTTQAVSISTGQVATLAKDAVIQGVTVGRGAGAVASNTAVGASALAANTTGAQNTAIGIQALQSTTSGDNNTAVGRLALKSNTTGANNTAVGRDALQLNTTGSDNSAVGLFALFNNTTGANNSAFGDQALNSNTTASNNTAVGYQAGYTNSTGANNVFLGGVAGYSSSGSSNLHVGYGAGYLSTGSNNTFVGAFGTGSTACGGSMTTGSKNTILGAYSGNQGGLDIRTASNYIVLSDGDGNPKLYFDNGNSFYINPIAGSPYSTLNYSIGASIKVQAFWQASNTNFYITNQSAGVVLASGGTSWASASDPRLKNITGTYTNALADIDQIQPIKFTWKSDESNKPCVGVDATTVLPVVPEAVDSCVQGRSDDQTKYLQVRYTELIPLMIASIKELKAEVDSLKAQINGASA
jgi:hypothetical protein